MAKLVPFNVGHLDVIEMREQEMHFVTSDFVERLEYLANSGTCWSIIEGGRVVSVVGAMTMWPGVVEVYLIPSIYVREYANGFVREVKKLLYSLESLDVYRIQSAALDDALHSRFMSFLGFVKEGTLKHFGPDKSDYNQWAKVLTR